MSSVTSLHQIIQNTFTILCKKYCRTGGKGGRGLRKMDPLWKYNENQSVTTKSWQRVVQKFRIELTYSFHYLLIPVDEKASREEKEYCVELLERGYFYTIFWEINFPDNWFHDIESNASGDAPKRQFFPSLSVRYRLFFFFETSGCPLRRTVERPGANPTASQHIGIFCRYAAI